MAIILALFVVFPIHAVYSQTQTIKQISYQPDLLKASLFPDQPKTIKIEVVESEHMRQEVAKAQALLAKKQAQRPKTINIQSSNENVALGQKMAAEAGWTGEQWTCLYLLWNRESGWRTNASNGRTWGIPQSLPGNKMAAVGADWRDNPATQISWGIGYIRGSYNTPCNAWAHSQNHNWY